MSTTRAGISPMTAADVLATNWPARVRSAAFRDGNALQAGPGNTIEAQSINTGEFGAIMLPNGGASFTTPEDRDQVLEKILHS